MSRIQTGVSWVLQVVVAGILLQTLFFKFTGAEESVYIFTTVGAEPWGRIGSGVMELVAAAMLLIPALVPYGALLTAATMSGALMSHLTILGIEVKGDGGLLFALALSLFHRRGDHPGAQTQSTPIDWPVVERRGMNAAALAFATPVLVETLQAHLHTLRALVDSLGEHTYRAAPRAASGSTGEHVRHCLDHVRALMAGVTRGEMSYDSRLRGTSIETDPRAAIEEIDRLCMSLNQIDEEMLASPLALEIQAHCDTLPVRVEPRSAASWHLSRSTPSITARSSLSCSRGWVSA